MVIHNAITIRLHGDCMELHGPFRNLQPFFLVLAPYTKKNVGHISHIVQKSQDVNSKELHNGAIREYLFMNPATSQKKTGASQTRSCWSFISIIFHDSSTHLVGKGQNDPLFAAQNLEAGPFSRCLQYCLQTSKTNHFKHKLCPTHLFHDRYCG